MKRLLPDNARCVITDISVGEACIGVMGPKARTCCAFCRPLLWKTMPFLSASVSRLRLAWRRREPIASVMSANWDGSCICRLMFAWHVLEAILATDENIRLCGMHAMDSCRLEKGFRHYGHDLSNEDHVLEAGLGFAVKCEKAAGKFGAFIGKDAV